MAQKNETSICVIGLGYVGLPLAVEFGKHYKTLGFDINDDRVRALRMHKDSTLELTSKEIKGSSFLKFSSKEADISNANIYIVTVPTPVTKKNLPDLTPLKKACNLISRYLKRNDMVIFESTVFPGATRDICVPILEKSGLILNKDFKCGYSPERINPGDKSKRLQDIVKVVSASDAASERKIKLLYGSIIRAGVYLAESIEVAEAAKVIENTQRDINIALMNELSLIFNRMNLDTNQVLDAAETKWNFLNFKPGLVGGHCIGVDPYYLTYIAKKNGYNPQVILSGRNTNNYMPKFIAKEFGNFFLKQSINTHKKKILVLGLTFKENCPDIRNSKVFDLIDSLTEFGFKIDAFDPFIKDSKASKHFTILNKLQSKNYDGLILAVPHSKFIKMGEVKLKSFIKNRGPFFDIKGVFPHNASDFRL